VPNFQIFRDETLNNKPIIFVRKSVKTHLRQSITQKFSGGGPPAPRFKGREREGGKSGRDKRAGRAGEGDGEVGRGGVEGRAKGKGRKEEGREEEFGPPQCSRQIDATGLWASSIASVFEASLKTAVRGSAVTDQNGNFRSNVRRA
jgi:hypothetical protein